MRTQHHSTIVIAAITCASVGVSGAPTATAELTRAGSTAAAELLVSGLGDTSGSTVGPDGALYVTHGSTGSITRVDPRTGATTTFAGGLPQSMSRRVLRSLAAGS